MMGYYPQQQKPFGNMNILPQMMPPNYNVIQNNNMQVPNNMNQGFNNFQQPTQSINPQMFNNFNNLQSTPFDQFH